MKTKKKLAWSVDFILPPALIIAPVQWDLIKEIQWATHAETPPPECLPHISSSPPVFFSAPSSGSIVHSALDTQVFDQLLDWSKTPFDGHHRPLMSSHMLRCAMSVHTPTTNFRPSGATFCSTVSLVPNYSRLYHRPNLLNTYTTILVAINCFSKACKLIPLRTYSESLKLQKPSSPKSFVTINFLRTLYPTGEPNLPPTSGGLFVIIWE